MNVELRIARSAWFEMQKDLDRSHPFAYERVGFLMIKADKPLATSGIGLEAIKWETIEDADYLRDDRVGASIGPEAFRKILQRAYFDTVGVLHVHRHHHRGSPAFSITDMRSMKSFIPSFFNAQASQPHGALLLSLDSALGFIRQSPQSRDLPINRIQVS